MARNLVDRLRVTGSLSLADRSTDDTFGWNEQDAETELEQVKEQLDELQQKLFAEERRSLLLVIQAMDAAGKDGTIRKIFNGLNPAGVRVTSFKVPGGRETVQDYLWRCHQAAPGRGEIGVFNRSHYEDVLVVRVKKIVPKSVWAKRFAHIVNFEQLLIDEGTEVVKVFLHVSKAEQARRFQDRLDDPTKRWKFRTGDLDDRALWNDFRRAYEEAIERTSTKSAPWYVVPADHNWSRNLAVAKILLHHLQRMNPNFPPAEEGLDGVKIDGAPAAEPTRNAAKATPKDAKKNGKKRDN
jgi:PPK2 family polyphosphate:nucleotide phosphotransferase